jgi:adenosine 3'-phospho 5'-phosphosulfate transporter B2
MIMGKIISRKKYEYYEYMTAVLISVGMAFFMLGSADDHKGNVTISLNVICLKSCNILEW